MSLQNVVPIYSLAVNIMVNSRWKLMRYIELNNIVGLEILTTVQRTEPRLVEHKTMHAYS